MIRKCFEAIFAGLLIGGFVLVIFERMQLKLEL